MGLARKLSAFGLSSALSILALMGTGCSSVKEELKPAKLEPVQVEYKLSIVWSAQVGSGQDSRYARLQPVVADGVIYLSDSKGRIFAVEQDSGKTLWRSKVKAKIGGGVGLSGDQLFVATLDGEVIALDRNQGQELWRAQASTEIVATPQANGDVVIAPTIDGRVFAFDQKTGEFRWSYDHPTPVLTLRANASPLLLGEDAYLGFDNGQLLKFNSRNGQLRWSARVGQPQGKTDIERLIDVDTAPLAIGPFVYAAGYKGRLIAVNRGTGRVSWARDVSTFLDMAAVGDDLVIVDDKSQVKAFNSVSGTEAWENLSLFRRDLGTPGALGDLVVAVDGEGILHGFAKDDGRLVLRKDIHDNSFAKPVAVDNLLYVYKEDGILSAYELEKLEEPRWTNIKNSRYRHGYVAKPQGVSVKR